LLFSALDKPWDVIGDKLDLDRGAIAINARESVVAVLGFAFNESFVRN
jgi:hypothetical protein